MNFKKKVKAKTVSREKSKQYAQDAMSAKEFYEGLCKGSSSIGSPLFDGGKREFDIISKICRYLGYTLVKKQSVLCTRIGGNNEFYVIHYEVK